MHEASEIDGVQALDFKLDFKRLMAAYERQLIQSALVATAGNQRRAAAALGLLPTTLHEKMKRLGLLRREPSRLALGTAS